MPSKKLPRKFYTRDAVTVAKAMLGKHLVVKNENQLLSGKIVETEAYIGPQDRASHAYQSKRTKRNRAEYLIGGHVYIYLVYGMYWQLNISTGRADYPECVLIRALALTPGEQTDQASGPGKLCRYLGLDKSFYGEDVVRSERIWLEDRGIKVKPDAIRATARIGIDYAGPYWAKRKLRFLIDSKR